MNWIKSALLTLFLSVCLLGVLEVAARVYVHLDFGSSIAGIRERTQNLNYQPFTMWGKDLDHNARAFVEASPKEAFRILLIGGSTATDFDTTLIEKAFTQQIGRPAVVFNSASSGFNIRQEAIALVLTAQKVRPDLILALDGANDVQHALKLGIKTGTTYLDQSYRTLLEKPYLGPLVYVLQHSQLYNGMLRLIERKAIDDQKTQDSVNAARDVYLETRQFIAQYAEGASVPVVYMLQPHIAFSLAPEDVVIQERFQRRKPFVSRAFGELRESTPAGLCFVDANQKLATDKLNLHFSDDVHFRDSVGYSFLAMLFAEHFQRCFGTAAMKAASPA